MTLLETDTPRQQFDRVPPYDIDAEMCLIASMLLDKEAIATTRGMFEREAFFQADHQVIFDVICEMYDAKKPVDGVLLREELARRHLLDEVGGSAYLGELFNKVPSAAHHAYYANIVREKHLWRQAIRMSNELLRTAYAPYSEDGSAGEAIADFGRRAARLAAEGKSNEIVRLGNVAREVVTMSEAGDVVRRIPTGIAKLDEVIGGLRRGGKNLIGGKPGMGKSLLLKQVLRNIAAAGTPVGLITVEEDRYKVAENALSSVAEIPNNRIAFGRLTGDEKTHLRSILPVIDSLPFFIVDSARKLSRIVAMAHALATQHGCQVIGVDHVHIVGPDVTENQNRERQISEISAGLKWAWKELGVAGVEAAQLNRKSGKERPDLDSLRDSGSLEQDGDVILLLHREDYYRVEEFRPGNDPPEMDGVLEVLVRKNKDGGKGTVELFMDEATQSVTDPPPRPTVDPFHNKRPPKQHHQDIGDI